VSTTETNDPFNLAATWRRMAEANLNYYSGYAKLTREYIDELSDSFGGGRRTAVGGPLGAATSHSACPTPSMALEGKLGASPEATFMVENGLSHAVRSPLVASSFKGPDRRQHRLSLTFEPDEVDLAPGEHVLVRVSVPIEKALKPGSPYRGDITIPGLPGTQVGVVVQRDSGA
jgi:hypothetical protein